jgi:hypothetical protein
MTLDALAQSPADPARARRALANQARTIHPMK